MENLKTYYYKDRITKMYILVLNGNKVGEKKIKKQAELWYQENKFIFFSFWHELSS